MQESDLDMMRALYENLDLPPGWKAEIIEGDLHVSPTAAAKHAGIIFRVTMGVGSNLDLTRWEVLTEVEVSHPSMKGLYIPDVVVTPLPYPLVDSSERTFDAAALPLVAEVTSPSNRDTDRGPKLRAYARSGVPLYLLIDRQNRTVHLYGSPAGETYTTALQVSFGGRLHLPAPFDFTLETADFD